MIKRSTEQLDFGNLGAPTPKLPGPFVVRSDLLNSQQDSFAELTCNLLADQSTTRVDAVSYVVERRALDQLGVLLPRACTRLLLVPPSGIRRDEAEDLAALSIPGLEVRQLKPGTEDHVPHLKLLLAERDDASRCAVIGSSNFTNRGIHKNIEINAVLHERDQGFDQVVATFETLWADYSEPLDPDSFVEELIASGERQLRSLLPFQREALAELLEVYKSRKDGALLSLPTGTGKTVVAARFVLRHVISRPDTRVLWVAPHKELLTQASDTFEWKRPFARLPQVRIEPPRLVNGSSDEAFHIVFRTLSKASRSSQVVDRDFDLIVVDEAHWGASAERQMMPALFDLHPTKFSLGLTATPFRTDWKEIPELRGFFGPVVLRDREEIRAAPDALGRPVLATERHEEVPTGVSIDLNESSFKGFDFKQSVLKEFNHEHRNRVIARAWSSEEHGKTLVFAINTKHANDLACAFARRRPKPRIQVAHTGELPSDVRLVVPPSIGNTLSNDDRELIYSSFRRGEIDVLIAVNLYIMGVDFPRVQTLFMARPTMSPVLYAQMLGRGLRGPAFGGTETINVVDFCDQISAHEAVQLKLMDLSKAKNWQTDLEERRAWLEQIHSRTRSDAVRYAEALQLPAVYRVVTPKRTKTLRSTTRTKDLSASLRTGLREGKFDRGHVVDYCPSFPDFALEKIEFLLRDLGWD